MVSETLGTVRDSHWTTKARIAWWAKYISMIAGTIIAIATAATLLGLRFDLQTASAAREQNEQLKKEMRDYDDRVRQDQATALREVKEAIIHLGDRIDNMRRR